MEYYVCLAWVDFNQQLYILKTIKNIVKLIYTYEIYKRYIKKCADVDSNFEAITVNRNA